MTCFTSRRLADTTVNDTGMKRILLHSICDGISPLCLSMARLRYLAQRGASCALSFDDGYADIYDALSDARPELLKRTTVFLVAERIGGRNDWDRSGPLAGRRLLDWRQIAELRRRGVAIGSHGLTHVDLTACGDRQLDAELRRSKELLEQRLGDAIEGFSYPYGAFDRRVMAAVAASYRWAVTARHSLRDDGPYQIPRIGFSGRNPEWLFRLKASNLWLYDLKALIAPLQPS